MRNEFFGNMIRVSKNIARKKWNEGKDIAFFPCYVRTDNKWIGPYISNKFCEGNIGYTFDDVNDYFIMFNCGNELGNYPKYFCEL